MMVAASMPPSPGPDFLCIGAQKGGTHWLYDQLQQHPDFWMPPIKELHYFDAPVLRYEKAKTMLQQATTDPAGINRNRAADSRRPLEPRDLEFLRAYVQLVEPRVPSSPARFLMAASSLMNRYIPGFWAVNRNLHPFLRIRAQPDFDGYAGLFAWKGDALSGDITPGYSTLSSGVVRQIMENVPGVKIIYLARDPVERYWSAMNMRAQKGRGLPGDRRSLKRHLRISTNADRSYQTEIVATWRRFVPAENFGLFLFDDLVSDAEGFRCSVLEFLGGDPAKPSGKLPPGFNRKKSGPRRSLSPEFRQLIGELLADELHRAAAEFGGAAALWPQKNGV